MREGKDKIIASRLAKYEESIKMAEFAIRNNYWNSAASELYYACFYLITALFEKHNIKAHTHSGVNSLFALHFIKQGKIEAKWGKLFSNLLDNRQEGDYGDMINLTEEEILPFVEEIEEFKKIVLELIKE